MTLRKKFIGLVVLATTSSPAWAITDLNFMLLEGAGKNWKTSVDAAFRAMEYVPYQTPGPNAQYLPMTLSGVKTAINWAIESGNYAMANYVYYSYLVYINSRNRRY